MHANEPMIDTISGVRRKLRITMPANLSKFVLYRLLLPTGFIPALTKEGRQDHQGIQALLARPDRLVHLHPLMPLAGQEAREHSSASQ